MEGNVVEDPLINLYCDITRRKNNVNLFVINERENWITALNENKKIGVTSCS